MIGFGFVSLLDVELDTTTNTTLSTIRVNFHFGQAKLAG